MSYIIRAALREEVNDGWIWNDCNAFRSRTVVKIKNPETKRSVICQIRNIDENYKKYYNKEGSRRIAIKSDHDTIVMSGWYRDALGISKTTDSDNETGKAKLTIFSYEYCMWGQLRAANHHPDIMVRIGIRLGALGAWLGLLGVVLGFLSLIQADGYFNCLGGGVLVLSAIFLILGCRSPKMI